MRPSDSDLAIPSQDGQKAGGVATMQGEAAGRGGADRASPRKAPHGLAAATWIVRICFAFVFVVNVQCALGFVFTSEAYMGAYELAGVPGRVGVQGIGVAFLMWNCTYPLVIWQPRRHKTLAGVVLAQQIVGLVGESLIRVTLPAGHDLLASSIDLFITFDAVGLVLMGASFAALLLTSKCARKRSGRP
ncbi:hypothetical protein [uncultured Adlercreutzia sp.]|uniref:hypothetical protein n=1 Tax=uncultured Adlercreutzia sp. TaxID=875803 RepID=UPI002676DEFC|nr:hypothetical protein [uncultured Adlercreutzia sp.]